MPFLIVVIGVSVLALIGAVIAPATSGGSYDRIGRDGLSIGEDRPPPRRRGRSAALSTAERDAQVRQYLAARNARRAARGEPPLDVEAELSGAHGARGRSGTGRRGAPARRGPQRAPDGARRGAAGRRGRVLEAHARGM